MPRQLNGQVVLVAGGALGISRATALTFAQEGAKLVIADLHAEGGQQTVHMITENGGEAIFVQTNVTQATAVEAMLSKTVETYDKLDCAHNNAGVAHLLAELDETTHGKQHQCGRISDHTRLLWPMGPCRVKYVFTVGNRLPRL